MEQPKKVCKNFDWSNIDFNNLDFTEVDENTEESEKPLSSQNGISEN